MFLGLKFATLLQIVNLYNFVQENADFMKIWYFFYVIFNKKISTDKINPELAVMQTRGIIRQNYIGFMGLL